LGNATGEGTHALEPFSPTKTISDLPIPMEIPCPTNIGKNLASLMIYKNSI
jgi:hypothetical protein